MNPSTSPIDPTNTKNQNDAHPGQLDLPLVESEKPIETKGSEPKKTRGRPRKSEIKEEKQDVEKDHSEKESYEEKAGQENEVTTSDLIDDFWAVTPRSGTTTPAPLTPTVPKTSLNESTPPTRDGLVKALTNLSTKKGMMEVKNVLARAGAKSTADLPLTKYAEVISQCYL